MIRSCIVAAVPGHLEVTESTMSSSVLVKYYRVKEVACLTAKAWQKLGHSTE